jgi:glycerate 2-kinase
MVSARDDAEAILRAAIAAADPAPPVRRGLRGAGELAGSGAVHVVAIGKAAPAMTEAALEVLEGRVAATTIVAPAGTPCRRPAWFGAHPLPDGSSMDAGRAVHATLREAAAAPGASVLVLLSGGGSAVAVVPLADITVEEYADCVFRLMQAGADIGELNTVRRHIDALKGGRMAALAAPAPVLGLVLSDVVGDSIHTVASGPLSPDPSTCADAVNVLRRHGVLHECAASVRRLLLESAAGSDCETTKPGDPGFRDVRVRLIGGNDLAVSGAAAAAGDLGYRVRRASMPVTGTARAAGAGLAREALRLLRQEELPACIVAGGETTVTVHGRGRGGRNQELVLAACIELAGTAGVVIGSVGTDGIDGPTPAAGAVADHATLERAAERGIDAPAALADNDSYGFFREAGGLIVTGATGTNVNDVQVALVTKAAAPPPPL